MISFDPINLQKHIEDYNQLNSCNIAQMINEGNLIRIEENLFAYKDEFEKIKIEHQELLRIVDLNLIKLNPHLKNKIIEFASFKKNELNEILDDEYFKNISSNDEITRALWGISIGIAKQPIFVLEAIEKFTDNLTDNQKVYYQHDHINCAIEFIKDKFNEWNVAFEKIFNLGLLRENKNLIKVFIFAEQLINELKYYKPSGVDYLNTPLSIHLFTKLLEYKERYISVFGDFNYKNINEIQSLLKKRTEPNKLPPQHEPNPRNLISVQPKTMTQDDFFSTIYESFDHLPAPIQFFKNKRKEFKCGKNEFANGLRMAYALLNKEVNLQTIELRSRTNGRLSGLLTVQRMSLLWPLLETYLLLIEPSSKKPFEQVNNKDWDTFRDKLNMYKYETEGIAELGRWYIKNNEYIYRHIPHDEFDKDVTPIPIVAKGISAFLSDDNISSFRGSIPPNNGWNSGKGSHIFYKAYFDFCLNSLTRNENISNLIVEERKTRGKLIQDHLEDEEQLFFKSQILYTELKSDSEKTIIETIKKAALYYPQWVRRSNLSEKDSIDNNPISEEEYLDNNETKAIPIISDLNESFSSLNNTFFELIRSKVKIDEILKVQIPTEYALSESKFSITDILNNNTFSPKELKSALRDYPTLNDKKFTLNQIALKYAWEGKLITKQNSDTIAKQYGHNSGGGLYNRYCNYSKQSYRIADPDSTDKILENKIELFKSVIQILPETSKQTALNDLEILETILNKPKYKNSNRL